MGVLLSKIKCRLTSTFHILHSKFTSSCFCYGNSPLIPDLPDEISLTILARVPRIYYLNLKAVSRCWKAAITSRDIYKVRKELGTKEEWLYILTSNHCLRLIWYALDPVSKKWQKLPPIPNVYAQGDYIRDLSVPGIWNMVYLSIIRIGDIVRRWIGKENLIPFQFWGCATGAVDGCLYILGGFSRFSTLKFVWKYDLVSNSWSRVNSMSVGRGYCKTGVLNNKLFVVGGNRIRSGFFESIQSAEVYDPETGLWSDLPSISFSKAYALQTSHTSNLRRPFATEVVSCRGKLYVPQGLFMSQFGVGGEVYDPETNSWVDMPTGMSEGWPVAGTRMSVNVDGDLYALDGYGTLASAKVNYYNHEDDSWKVVDGEVPVREFTETSPPCLVAGLLGKLHVVTKDDNYDIVVMRVDKRKDLNTSSGEGTSEPNIWSVIALMHAGYITFVSCQTLDI